MLPAGAGSCRKTETLAVFALMMGTMPVHLATAILGLIFDFAARYLDPTSRDCSVTRILPLAPEEEFQTLQTYL